MLRAMVFAVSRLADVRWVEFAVAKVNSEMKSYGTAILVLCALLVSACSGSQPPPKVERPTDERPAITGQPASFNSDDLAFATNLVASYGQSAALTDLVPAHSSNTNLGTLASAIDAERGPRLEMMKVLLVQWNSDSNADQSQESTIGDAPVMVDVETMARLQSLRGKDFDTLWLRSMIGHQEGVVALAQREIQVGANVDAIATARQVVDAERALVRQMQQTVGAG